MTMEKDWYEHRHELRPEQVFRMHEGSVVKLDHRVPGDGTQWRVADWWNGWAYMESTIEPGDLAERLPDNYAGETLASNGNIR
jgi:hypothetical protein